MVRMLRSSRTCCVMLMLRNALLGIRHCSGGLRTSYNFIRRPITPNPFRSTDSLCSLLPSVCLCLSLSFFPFSTLSVHTPVNHVGTRARVRAGISARDFLPFSGGSPGKRGESNDKAFTQCTRWRRARGECGQWPARIMNETLSLSLRTSRPCSFPRFVAVRRAHRQLLRLEQVGYTARIEEPS